jgi:hypothetical protein
MYRMNAFSILKENKHIKDKKKYSRPTITPEWSNGCTIH